MRTRISVKLAALAAASLATSLSAQTLTLQKQNSIALGTQFLTGGAYGDFPLSVGFANGSAYIGGFNSSTTTTNSVGVVRIDNALTGTTTFSPLASSTFTANVSRGLDGITADSTGVYLAYDDGNGTNAFIRKVDNDGNTVWNTPSSSFVSGYRPTALAIDPLANNGAPALASIGNGSGRRVAFNLADGTVIYGPTGFAGTLGEIVNPNPTSVNGVTLGSGYRGIAFDSAGNVAVTAAGGTSYGIRDTQGGPNFNRIVNPLDNAGSQTQPILAKQTNAGAAAFVAQGLGFIEGLGSSTLLATSERVGGTFELTLRTATDKSGNFTEQTGLDSRNLFIRKTDGSVPTNLTNPNLVGDEDGLAAAYSTDLKNIAIGRDANNNPVILVLSYTQKRLDIYGIEPQWTTNTDGSWSDASKWTLGIVPDARTTNATFSTGITASRTITLDGARSVKQLKFNNANRVTINGTSTLTLGSPTNNAENVLPAYITVANGSHTVNAPIALGSNARFDVTNASDTLTVGNVTGSGKGLTKRGAGKLEAGHIRVGTYVMTQGATVLKANGTEAGMSRVGSLVLDGGTLDLTNNGLIVDYPTDLLTSPYNDLLGAMMAGTISSSLTDSGKALGIVERGSATTPTFTDPALIVDSTTVLIRFTLRGDTNLDKAVTFDDLLVVAQNYGMTSGALWGQGDSNYDGQVNFDDLLLVAQNYGLSLTLAGESLEGTSETFASDFAIAQSLVPEPATLGLFAGVAAIGLRRRK